MQNLVQIVLNDPMTFEPEQIIEHVEDALKSINLQRKKSERMMFSYDNTYNSDGNKEAFAVILRNCRIANERGEPILALVYFDNVSSEDYVRVCEAIVKYGTIAYQMTDPERSTLDSLRRKMHDMASKKSQN